MTAQLPNPSSAELAEISALDRPALTHRWALAFGSTPPRHSHVNFMRSALAWHSQMKQQAGSTAGGVDRLIRTVRRKAASATPALTLAPGTRLLRHWQGQTYHVTVLADGFEYAGQTYRSLTAIARQITGTPWSGPLFFGLRS